MEVEMTPMRSATVVPYMLVFAGGAVGTGIRILFGTWWASSSSFPWPTFIMNVSGAILLGALYGATRGGRMRLLLGTGVLGGYTTYSTFAVGSDGLILTDHLLLGVLYVVPTVVLGVVGAFAAQRLTGTRKVRA
ncbi:MULTISPECIES: fluoride efflux transporter FluC [Microbacterium]|uniref:fluoride efflux transporter FluC n=1 Tax=Microbacterium TaxID=33882 RepID=UPI0019D353C0|nr:CrcB family protein [Microbacterium oxydans]